MDDINKQILEPVEVQPEPLPELTYRYQPTDDEGNRLGGAQVIKYHTQDELIQKMTENHTLAIRQLRAETRKNRLGIVEDEVIDPEAKRFSGLTDFTPRELTGEERFQLSRDLLDPEKAVEAQAKLAEAQFGARPEVISSTLREIQEEQMKSRAVAEANIFVADTPDYFVCQKNYQALTSWMVRYDLAPVRENFRRAYDALNAQGVLILKPESEIRAIEPIPVPEHRPTVFAPSVIPSGLTRDEASDVGGSRSVGDEFVYDVAVNGKITRLTGLAALNAMPGQEYGKLLKSDPNFARKVEKLEAEAKAARAANQRR